MDIKMDVIGSFDNVREWLNRIAQDDLTIQTMEEMGQAGVDALYENTPKDTGQTAAGWGYDLKVGRKESELSWYNHAHPHVSGNMARMIYTGYGNRTGGYVPPRDYITPSMSPIYQEATYRVVEAIMNG